MNIFKFAQVAIGVLCAASGVLYAQQNSPETCPCTPLTKADVDQMPLIEAHCHADLRGANAFDFRDLIALQRTERLSYVLTIIHDDPEEIAAVSENRDMIGALLFVDPRQENYLEAVDKFTREHRDILRGYKLHPSGTGFEINSAVLDGLFALANREKLLIVSHTDNVKSQAGGYRPLLEKYPDTKLILYHASPAAEAFALANEFPNVYLDVSFLAWGKEFQQNALRTVGKKKILFGIDSPLGFKKTDGKLNPHYREAAAEVAAFYDNDRDVVEHVFYKNAARLLGLPE